MKYVFDLPFLWWIYLQVDFVCYSSADISMSKDTGKACTYFGGRRVSSPQSSLVNCSWYASNACCKRTEVTSVFAEMYPLFGATTECSNKLNYLMCYFCSPDQYKWYNKRASICKEYCSSLYEDCKTAMYEGVAIGEVYHSGDAFCQGQKFEVVDGNNCFDFDPDVFGEASSVLICSLTYVLGTMLAVASSSWWS